MKLSLSWQALLWSAPGLRACEQPGVVAGEPQPWHECMLPIRTSIRTQTSNTRIILPSDGNALSYAGLYTAIPVAVRDRMGELATSPTRARPDREFLSLFQMPIF